MRSALTAVAAFTTLASAWLFVMFLVLHRPGFERNASFAVIFILLGAATLVVANVERAPGILRIGLVGADAALAILGAWIIVQNNSSAHFEGYLLIIGLSFVVQGLLAVWWALGQVPQLRSR